MKHDAEELALRYWFPQAVAFEIAPLGQIRDVFNVKPRKQIQTI